MAGDWFPVTVGIGRRREVLTIAQGTKRSRFEVVGLLVDFWGWVTEESRDGHVPCVTPETLIVAVGADEGFWTAVEAVGWAAFAPEGLEVPNWERWFGRSAKVRLQAVMRKRIERSRVAGCHANVTPMSRSGRDKSATTEDRGEIENRDEMTVGSGPAEPASPPPPAAPSPPPPSPFAPHPDLAGLDLWREDRKLAAAWTAFRAQAEKVYPALDLQAELEAAHLHQVANPKERRRDVVRFLHNWFRRSQENPRLRARRGAPRAAQGGDVPDDAKELLAGAMAFMAENDRAREEGKPHGLDRQ